MPHPWSPRPSNPDRSRPVARILPLILVLVAGGLAAGCSSDDPPALADPPAPLETTATDGATTAAVTSTTTTLPVTPSETATTPEPEPAGQGCASVEPGVRTFTSEAGGVPVRVRVLVPSGFAGAPLPAVLDWHGLGSNGEQELSLTGYGLLAASEGFIAVHPTGAPAPGGAQNSWELTQLDVPGRDDLAMVDEVIDTLVAEHCADPDRIYSTGMSNGGFFTSRLVCERADRIAAAVSVAGVTHPDGCEPSRPVPYLAFHGTADEIVPYGGGRSSLQVGPSSSETDAFFTQVMPDEFAEFAADFGCDPEPELVRVSTEVIRHDHVGCDDGVTRSFYEITDGGHTWPGSPLGPLLTQALGHTTDEVDATAEGWAFMSRFSLP